MLFADINIELVLRMYPIQSVYNMHVYMGLLRPAWCKFTLLHFPCSTCFGCNIHPTSGASYNAHAAGTCKCTVM